MKPVLPPLFDRRGFLVEMPVRTQRAGGGHFLYWYMSIGSNDRVSTLGGECVGCDRGSESGSKRVQGFPVGVCIEAISPLDYLSIPNWEFDQL